MKKENLRRERLGRAKLLDLIRRGEISDWDDLCEFLEFPRDFLSTTNEGYFWRLQIRILQSTGFLEVAADNTFQVTAKCEQMQEAFDIGLSEIANISNEGSSVVTPIFGPPTHQERLDVFVLMSFSKSLEPIYADHILKVTREMALVTKRADDLYAASPIVQDVWNSINAASIIVADCTDKNPNVFYELGIAHTIGKQTIILTQDEDIPFDINHIRLIKYTYTPRGMQECENKLRHFLSSAISAL